MSRFDTVLGACRAFAQRIDRDLARRAVPAEARRFCEVYRHWPTSDCMELRRPSATTRVAGDS